MTVALTHSLKKLVAFRILFFTSLLFFSACSKKNLIDISLSSKKVVGNNSTSGTGMVMRSEKLPFGSAKGYLRENEIYAINGINGQSYKIGELAGVSNPNLIGFDNESNIAYIKGNWRGMDRYLSLYRVNANQTITTLLSLPYDLSLGYFDGYGSVVSGGKMLVYGEFSSPTTRWYFIDENSTELERIEDVFNIDLSSYDLTKYANFLMRARGLGGGYFAVSLYERSTTRFKVLLLNGHTKAVQEISTGSSNNDVYVYGEQPFNTEGISFFMIGSNGFSFDVHKGEMKLVSSLPTDLGYIYFYKILNQYYLISADLSGENYQMHSFNKITGAISGLTSFSSDPSLGYSYLDCLNANESSKVITQENINSAFLICQNNRIMKIDLTSKEINLFSYEGVEKEIEQILYMKNSFYALTHDTSSNLSKIKMENNQIILEEDTALFQEWQSKLCLFLEKEMTCELSINFKYFNFYYENNQERILLYGQIVDANQNTYFIPSITIKGNDVYLSEAYLMDASFDIDLMYPILEDAVYRYESYRSPSWFGNPKI